MQFLRVGTSRNFPWRVFTRLSTAVCKCSSNASLFFTEKSVKRLKQIGAKGVYMRVVVDSGGCSGFRYKFEIADKVQENDQIIVQNGVTVFIDNVSLDLIKGSTIDYEDELIRSGFYIVNNPQVDKSCSCGVSFSLKLD
uniref:Iron-sulfur cluster assembly 2 homolog, mitochondrial n=1 Tax=Trichobilharzia regenti TaxID=157069 RepID=A0AA85JZZ1_TRIRE|nr:unnamed protein product [Trichobilharzia regenti]